VPLFGQRAVGKFGLVITGLNELRRKIRPGGEVERKVQAALVRAMIENVEDLLSRSMRDAPVKEGFLRATGTAEVLVNGKRVSGRGVQTLRLDTGGSVSKARLPEMARKGIEIEQQVIERGPSHEAGGRGVVGIVAFNMPYALVQHERLDFHHPKGGKAKYLEDNLKQRATVYADNMGQHVAGALA